MNANPPPRPRFSSRRPPLWRATARRGRPGSLPRFTTGSARDAINLRWNYTNEINLATGEWTRAGYRAPVCYVTNTRPIVRATFSAAPADLPAVRLFAETSAAVGEHWRVRSATDTISWDFSDAPEDVYAYLWRPNADSIFGDLVGFKLGKTPSLSLDLPPGDYLLDFYFPRVYDGGFSAAWSTNYLHILDNPSIVSLGGCSAQNRAAHHTALYETNAVVVRRAQSFRFKTTVTKWFDPSRHELRFFLADDFDGQWTTNEVLAGTGTQPTTEWFYKTVSTTTATNGDITLVADIYCSTTNCPVGAYRIGARLYDRQSGERLDEKELDQDLIVLFNPWSDKDSVYMADDGWRNECVLATKGRIWTGEVSWKSSISWDFAQFQNPSLSSALLGLNDLDRNMRTAPTIVSRYFSDYVNASPNGENGILEGKWSGDYRDGISPMNWKGSLPLFVRYIKYRMPVKYGQCWVFAGVLTSCLRSLGIPSRPVTNYESGHDTGFDKSIDIYVDEDDNILDSSPDDFWNFHVWTECWIIRVNPVYLDCWQVVDATPQEPSDGAYQCGPAARIDVKAGRDTRFDTVFVYGEVCAPLVVWKEIDGVFCTNEVLSGRIGLDISTKAVSSETRLEITTDYKENP